MSYNKLLKFAAKNAAGQLLAGFAYNTRNCPLAGRWYDSPCQAGRAISCFFFKAIFYLIK